MKKIKNYFIDMISDTSGHINSKIVMGIVSFIVASVLAFMGADTTYVAYFLAFSGGSLGFSCFDNNSAFKFHRTETSTETIKKETNTKIDVDKIAKTFKRKK